MDEKITQAALLLDQKKELFEAYEQVTKHLAECTDFTDMEKYITIRAQLATAIDLVDGRIKGQLASFGALALAALGNRCERGELDERLIPIFDKSQEILAIVYRIEKMNRALLPEYERIKEQSLMQIKSSSDTVKVNKYLSNLSVREKGNNFGKV